MSSKRSSTGSKGGVRSAGHPLNLEYFRLKYSSVFIPTGSDVGITALWTLQYQKPCFWRKYLRGTTCELRGAPWRPMEWTVRMCQKRLWMSLKEVFMHSRGHPWMWSRWIRAAFNLWSDSQIHGKDTCLLPVGIFEMRASVLRTTGLSDFGPIVWRYFVIINSIDFRFQNFKNFKISKFQKLWNFENSRFEVDGSREQAGSKKYKKTARPIHGVRMELRSGK